MHWPHRGQVLLDHGFNGAAALRNVAAEAANETNVVGRIDEDFDVELFQQARIGNRIEAARLARPPLTCARG
jgi:hypothetical protein